MRIDYLKWTRTTALALGLVLFGAVIASAASYARTTLRDLTQKAVAIVEVDVIERNYPPLKAGQNFPRTQVSVKVRRTLKGDVGQQFTLDTPGGINGNVASYVPDGPEFKVGERAIVFVKQPEPGLFMVHELGLGKFNIVERNGRTYVESPLCARAIAPNDKGQTDETSLLQKSIPYDKFCALVADYAAGKNPAIDVSALSESLLPSASHQHGQPPAVLADARAEQQAAQLRKAWLAPLLVISAVALLAALWVRRRRRHNAPPLGPHAIVLALSSALLAGGALGGASIAAFVPFSEGTTWDLKDTLAGKIADGRIIWRQSQASKTNADVFINVQQSFDKWENVPQSLLAFTAGGATTTTSANSGDTQNVVSWNTVLDNDFGRDTLAITFSSFSVGSTSRFLDADIIFNDKDFDWQPGGSGNSASVSLHEIGHFIGLNHTTDRNTVMFPFDSGILQLSSDEVLAAQTLYPGNDGGSTLPTGPLAQATGSPTTGAPGLVVSFSGTGSQVGQSGSALVSFEWDFGDGATASGAETTHTYTALGSYTATLRVTDAAGESGADTLLINVGTTGTALKGGFKLNFKQSGKDGFTCSLFSTELIGIKAPRGTGTKIAGKVNIGSEQFPFVFDTEKAKSSNFTGVKVSVNDKQGVATFMLKNTDLAQVLREFGATNSTQPGKQVSVPVGIFFGEGTDLFVFGEVKFFYKSAMDKGGAGKF